jgi:hypothetical protein
MKNRGKEVREEDAKVATVQMRNTRKDANIRTGRSNHTSTRMGVTDWAS